VPGEDGVGTVGGEFPAATGVPGLQDDRVQLRAARQREVPGDVEVVALVPERPWLARRGPGLPQLARRLDELGGADVTVAALQVAAAPEVLPGERVRGGHDVPAGPAAGQVVQGGELPRDFVRLVVRGLDRAEQAELAGDGGEGGQDGHRVRPSDDVQVVDRAALLAQPQPFREEEEVERGGLGGAGQVRERGEGDLAARRRVAPHRVVVDAGEVRAEDHLLLPLAAHALTASYRFAGRGRPRRSRSERSV
jgi:hypothetical protein